MPSNAGMQPISIAERRAMRQANQSAVGDAETLTAAQQRAYRQLAIYSLGLDIATLTRQLRARRLQRMPELRIVPTSDRAA
jgi:hypothetical protein